MERADVIEKRIITTRATQEITTTTMVEGAMEMKPVADNSLLN
jgi:hypothetical protein